ncbi:AAA family ATPase [Propionimicrobium sp. PCR01-08-3]|uniref:HelD family protein n=1 Tax=Propionimicrobium sp. PCR01-08-3 TaxID=3052086 RepID=UPI00255D0129|nr:AAA family ATPase [Propionimicrobium sp. PCR01-08-3]WIY81665.1 AAA family ATPase [Propionimicrobium sp. PCR01-08-3]
MSEEQSPSTNEILAHELAIEQAHVDKVYRYLASATEAARQVQAESRAKYQTDRADWMREEDSTALFERDAFAYQAAKRLAILDAEHEGLVFGRLDFTDENEDKRYIGRLGVRDEDYEPLVIDWRAPAAEAFYRATAADPMGVSRRRTLRCRDDLVVSIEDDLLDEENSSNLPVIGEGALMAALKRARGPRMRDIVATIQAEQDMAIRAPYQGVTVISGGPGTGKTVVALHRAAFLLYTHRKRMEAGGVLVVGPTDLFMSYIERVLPGLGEDSVTLKSVGELASDVLGFGTGRVDDAEAAMIKGSLRMLPVLRRAVFEPMTSGNIRLRVSVKGEILTLEAGELNTIRRAVLNSHKANRARPAAEKALTDALWAKLPTDIAALLDLSREVFDDIVTSQASYAMFLNAWWPILTPEAVLARLADPALLRKFAHEVLDADERHVLADSLDHARDFIPGTGMHPDWSVADIALLDELAAMIGPAPVENEVDPALYLEDGTEIAELVTLADQLTDTRETDPDDDGVVTHAHVLVDEAQDITPMQWRMLRRRGPQASWTLVGDPAQSSYPNDDETERAMRDLIGRGSSRTFRLSTNYRSPAEIMDLAGKVITSFYPDADVPTSVRQTGVDPRLLSVPADRLPESLGRVVTELGRQVEGSIAIICAAGRFGSVRDTVASMPLDDAVRARLTVVTALQAKGLEFDAAIVVAPDEIVDQTPGGMRVLYVALTRPTQRLVTIDLGDGRPGAWRESLE